MQAYSVPTAVHQKPTLKTQFLHFDSIYATQVSEQGSSTGNALTPYNAQFVMNQAFFKVKKIYLKSFEISIGFSNIRAGSTDKLSMIVNGTTYTVYLPEKNYSTIAALITQLNTSCTSLVSGISITFALTGSLLTPLRLQISAVGATTTKKIAVSRSLSK
jgi:hypothetical protein